MRPERLAHAAFFGPYGLRAGWRLFLFVVVAALLGTAVSFLGAVLRQGMPFDGATMVRQATNLAIAFGATWILAKVDERPLLSYGLGPDNRLRNFIAGAASAFLGLSILMALLFAAGAARFDTPGLRGVGPAASWAAYWLAFFLCVGFAEEMLTRGYPLFAAAQGIGFWPAAALFSAIFGLGHLGNTGEDYVGIANAVIAGLVFAFSLKWTGSLWWAIGAHVAWDWGQTYFFGVPDSGIPARHHLLTIAAAGPAWLSGGATGPEGSVLALPVLLLLALAVRFTAPRVDSPDLVRRRAPAAAPAETPAPASPPSISPSTYSVDSGDTN